MELRQAEEEDLDKVREVAWGFANGFASVKRDLQTIFGLRPRRSSLSYYPPPRRIHVSPGSEPDTSIVTNEKEILEHPDAPRGFELLRRRIQYAKREIKFAVRDARTFITFIRETLRDYYYDLIGRKINRGLTRMKFFFKDLARMIRKFPKKKLSRTMYCKINQCVF